MLLYKDILPLFISIYKEMFFAYFWSKILYNNCQQCLHFINKMTEFDLSLDMTCLVRVAGFFTLNSLPLKTSYSPVTRLMPVKRLSEEHNHNVRFEAATQTPAYCPSICIWIKLQKTFSHNIFIRSYFAASWPTHFIEWKCSTRCTQFPISISFYIDRYKTFPRHLPFK